MVLTLRLTLSDSEHKLRMHNVQQHCSKEEVAEYKLGRNALMNVEKKWRVL